MTRIKKTRALRDQPENGFKSLMSLRRTPRMALVTFLLVAGLAGFVPAAFSGLSVISAAPRFAAAAQPADTTSVFSADKGRLRITINGQRVGSEDFEISAAGESWVEHSSTTARAPGGPEIKATGQLKLSSDGTPIRYDWSAKAQKKATGFVDFASSTAKCSADLGAALPLRKDFVFTSPRIAVLDNNLYYQFGLLARLYDWKTGGKQTFPVVIPQDMVPGTISVESLGPQQSGNSKLEGLKVSSPDLEIMLYVDASHRMMRLEVPSSNVTIERE